MQALSDSILPITSWLNNNPTWAGIITFLISFSESLAIIGSIIPGSVTMTAIGILIGTGIIPAKSTFTWAILGAIAGDSASYYLGFYYKDRIKNCWPFAKHPHWLNMGKDYFEKHGGKSVLIGRFIGPLRSIIPLIAGSMQMPTSRFLIANILSAIGWSFLYILPGVFIGAATTELSADTATRLFIYVLVALLALWLMSFITRWLVTQLSHYFEISIDKYWLYLSTHPRLKRFSLLLINNQNHSDTLRFKLFLFALFLLILYSLLTILSYSSDSISNINSAYFHFIHSIRTDLFNYFFIVIRSLSHNNSLICMIVVIFFSLIMSQRQKIAIIWMANALFIFSLTYLLSRYMVPLQFSNHIKTISFSYPDTTSLIASNLILLLTYMLNSTSGYPQRNIVLFISSLAVCLIGLSSLYVENNILFTVFASLCMGMSIATISYLFMKRSDQNLSMPVNFSPILLITVALTALFINYTTGESKRQALKQTITTHYIALSPWWQQHKPVMPLYRYNRFGHPIALLNIQWLDNLKSIEQQMLSQGFKKANLNSYLHWLERLAAKNKLNQLPVFTQLLNDKKPTVTLYKYTNDKTPLIILRLWPSPIQIKDSNKTMWLGSMHYRLIYQQHWHPFFHSSKKHQRLAVKSLLSRLALENNIKSIKVKPNNLLLNQQLEHSVYLIRRKQKGLK